MSVPSTTSTGYGHLVLTAPPPEYAIRDATLFPAPTNPGLNPVHQRNVSAEELAETNRQHRLLREYFSLYYTLERALKTLLVAAVPHLFIADLHDEALGWGNTTTLQLLTHLHTTYRGIDEDMLAENLERIKTPWSPPTPIDTLFLQIKSCMRFAQKGGDPISSPSAQRTCLAILEATGLFRIPFREWRSKTGVDKTLPNFLLHFRAADKENRREMTTLDGGYQPAAHNISQVDFSPLEQPRPDEAEQTMLTTPSAFATAVAEAASYHHPPSLLVPAPVIDYAALAAAMAGNTITSAGSSSNDRNGSNRRRGADLSGHGYCWSHGFMRNASHTSMTCRNKKVGHKDAATATNKMGGKEHVWRLNNDN